MFKKLSLSLILISFYSLMAVGETKAEADLSWADLKKADLRGADLSKKAGGETKAESESPASPSASPSVCDKTNYKDFIFNKQKTDQLINETGRGCDLRGADLRLADLAEADFRGADLSGAYLLEAILSGAKLRGAKFDKNTKFPESFTPSKSMILVN